MTIFRTEPDRMSLKFRMPVHHVSGADVPASSRPVRARMLCGRFLEAFPTALATLPAMEESRCKTCAVLSIRKRGAA